MSQFLRCGSKASCSVCGIELFHFGDGYVWGHGLEYELADREGAYDRVGETYFESASVGGVDDAYAVGEHGVVFDDGGSCYDFGVVSWWWFDADARVVHSAAGHVFDFAYAYEIVAYLLWSCFDWQPCSVIVYLYLHGLHVLFSEIHRVCRSKKHICIGTFTGHPCPDIHRYMRYQNATSSGFRARFFISKKIFFFPFLEKCFYYKIHAKNR